MWRSSLRQNGSGEARLFYHDNGREGEKTGGTQMTGKRARRIAFSRQRHFDFGAFARSAGEGESPTERFRPITHGLQAKAAPPILWNEPDPVVPEGTDDVLMEGEDE